MTQPRVAVGVDLGGTNMRAALVELGSTGQILKDVKVPVPAERTPETVADLMQRLVGEVDPDGRRLGVGVGFAGMLRGWSGVVVNAPNFGWREVDFRSLLRARLGPNVELYNDLNAIAYGEATYGAARGARDVLCVFVGTGLGAGLVLDGKLYIGATHLAGEIGHAKVVPGGRMCGCGSRGCIEAYVSGVNVRARLREELKSQPQSPIIALAGGLDQVHGGHADQAAQKGDPYAVALWQEVSQHLAMLLSTLVAALNPSHIVLGGGMWEGSPDLQRRVHEAFTNLVSPPSAVGLTLVNSALGQNAGVLGASALIAAGEVR